MSKLSQYESFVAIVRTGSLRLAAESLNRTPSALSKHIANLEQDLEVQLFDRSNKQMVLTGHGSTFYQSSSAILKQIADSERQIKLQKGTIAGQIRITVSKSLIGSNLSQYLNEFALKFPNVSFSISYSEMLENFSERDYDFAFRIGTLADSTRLVARELMQVSPTFYATPDYLACFGQPTGVSELSTHRVALPHFEMLSAEVRGWLKKHGFSHQSGTHHYMDDVNAIKSMTLEHGCIGFHLSQSLFKLIANGTVVPLFQDNKMPAKQLYFVYRKVSYQSAHLQTFKNFIIDKYRGAG